MYIKRLNVNMDENVFEGEFKEKNLNFFKSLENESAKVYHAKANINYYDLVTVQVRNIFNSVPAPLFEEWTGIHPEDIPGVEVISRDYLEKIISKERTIRETEEFWSSNISFDSQVGQIIRDLTNGDSLVLD